MRPLSRLCLCLCLLIALPQGALAQDDDIKQREEALFGEPEAPQGDEALNAREDEIFGDDEPSSTLSAPQADAQSEDALELAMKLAQANERLAIGGFLFMQSSYAISQDQAQNRLDAPQLLDLYLDARPNDRVRAYARARLLYNPTIPATQANATLNISQPTGNDLTLLNQGRQREQVLLDQLWVNFDLGQKLFLTVGRQRIRWGAGRFWNPTDFLNATQINPLALFDQRLGVDLIKLHYPIESLGWNLYAVAMLSDAKALKDIGGALRAEAVFGTNEIALTFAARRQTFQGPQALPPIYSPSLDWPKTSVPLRLGLDYTGALGPFDLRFEGALTRGLAQPFYRGQLNIEDLSSLQFPQDYRQDERLIPQLVAGLELMLKYSDQDSLILSAEYFYNGAGYEDSDLYLWTLLQGGFRPLYMGKHYAAMAVVLPSPGSLNTMNFTGSALGNLSDGSFIGRLDYSLALRSSLTFNLYAMKHFGNVGEFKLGFEVPPIPGNDALEDGLTFAPPSWDLGAGLRLNF